MQALVELHDVSKIRDGYALEIPHLEIEAGATLAITGPSGCGKSTALDVLGMVLKPERAGAFVLRAGGQELDVATCWKKGRQDVLAAARLAHIGYVLQTGGLLPFLRVCENMELGAELLGQVDRKERVHDLARRMGIEGLLDAMPGRLSIGERQRVAIGRALVTRPALLLADEPTAALDPHHAETVLGLFLETVADLGVTLIMVTHDPQIVARHGLQELRMRLERSPDGASRAVLES